ncbi:flagellar hook-associated protein FlgK [Haloimpatiens sp. FM7330]|uniref:flagellar hook-associated protein FlgK n=1 Tax=Haloimpatiens sp. FM7330 TaxID=3298610 RepID=UPI00362A3AC7
MSGLFATFNVAKRGLFAQQKCIDVTSHNIANANTEGYSRQRALLETTRPFQMPSMNNAMGPGQLGTGAQVSIIQRVRDEFLDFQVRNESSTMGMYQARDKMLSDVEAVFNEPSDEGLSNIVGKFFDAWQQLSTQAETSTARTKVAQQSKTLTNELNHIYNQLQKTRSNTQLIIKDTVFQINNMLSQIDQLNQQIMNVKVSGQEPNDLMDKRDLLFDKISKEFNIDLKKKNFDAYDLSPDNIENVPDGGEKLLVRKEPNYAVSRFSYVNGIEPPRGEIDDSTNTITIHYLKNGDSNAPGKTIKIDVNGLSKAEKQQVYRHVDECRVVWAREDGTAYSDNKTIQIKGTSNTDFNGLDKQLGLFNPSSGSLRGYMSVQEDVDKYEDHVNKLAKAMAFAVNAVHSGISDAVNNPSTPPEPDKDYMPFFVNSDKAKYDSNGKITNLDEVLSGETEINAGNIAINENILKDVMQIKTRIHDDKYATATENHEDGETDGKRALAIAGIRDTLFKIQDLNINGETTRKDFIDKMTGGLKEDNDLGGVKTIHSDINGMTIDNYFKDTVDTIGIQEDEARRIVKNQEKLLGNFEERRASVSGVSLDEEMANLIQFQHAYGANAKIISTVDELLDVVVNGLKR